MERLKGKVKGAKKTTIRTPSKCEFCQGETLLLSVK